MKEADRLQSLMDRLLTPHRLPQAAPLNVHEVLERVRSLILAEFPRGISDRARLRREPAADRGRLEQLIQAVLNIARNAAQAITSKPRQGAKGEIALRTRVVRQVTLARRRYRHAIAIDIWRQRSRHTGGAARAGVLPPRVRARRRQRAGAHARAELRQPAPRDRSPSRARPGRTCFTILLPAESRKRIVNRESMTDEALTIHHHHYDHGIS